MGVDGSWRKSRSTMRGMMKRCMLTKIQMARDLENPAKDQRLLPYSLTESSITVRGIICSAYTTVDQFNNLISSLELRGPFKRVAFPVRVI